MFQRIIAIVLGLLLASAAGTLVADGPVAVAKAKGRYVTGDFHQHTTYTDGANPIATVMYMADSFGLDWWANSEHGGIRYTDGAGPVITKVAELDTGMYAQYWDASLLYPDLKKFTAHRGLDILGDIKVSGGHQGMWRWQSLRDFSFRNCLTARIEYRKPIIQGVEWNVPGHEHCSVGIIAGQFADRGIDSTAEPVAQFDYLFDASDADTTGGAAEGYGEKSNTNDHAKAVAAAAWLQENFPYSSWMVPAHVERAKKYKVSDFRDLNNAAPDVCFGFESMPGHQKESDRGSYSPSADGGGTYGGCGIFAAKVGGLWDALLGEGRRWWLFASSDFHSTGADFWPGEYQKTYTFVNDPSDPQAIVDGLRSGNSFVVEGDLIDGLDFQVRSFETKIGERRATMGGVLSARPNGSVLVVIRFRSPDENNHGDPVRLDHIDLIAGEFGGLIDPLSPEYAVAENLTTRVIATFPRSSWTVDDDGWFMVRKTVRLEKKNLYFRLRGTNLPPNTDGQTDASGNPSLDVPGTGTADAAWADLWFYSNPVFVRVTK